MAERGEREFPPGAEENTFGFHLGPGDVQAERQRMRVELTAFQGPLDLLLHLVRVNEIDIYDIPVVEIARQYDEHLERMRQLDLNIAGEFLVLAATLAYIKSRMLLPRNPSEDGDGPEDPRRPLTEMLLEHQRFLMAAESLSARADVQATLWTRPDLPREDPDDEMTLEVSLVDLVRVFRGLLEQVGAGGGLDLEAGGVSVERRMDELLERLDADRMLPLVDLFPDGSRKQNLITTFLAVLELLRLRMITLWQSRQFGEIRVCRANRPSGDGPVTES